MAYNNLQRHSSVHGQHTCIDGVPFRITDGFKPPPEIHLPNGFSLPSQTASLVCTYDFQLEEQVIAWAAAVEKSKRDQEEETLRRQQEEDLPCSSSSSSLEEDSVKEETQEDRNNANGITAQQSLINFSGDTILTPIKATNAMANIRLSNSEGAERSPFDYTMFERESDPFDSLELKTIDDLAELKNVLQPQSSRNDASASTPPAGSNKSQHQEAACVTLRTEVNNVVFNKNSNSNPSRELASKKTQPIPAPRNSKLPPLPASRSGNRGNRPPRPANSPTVSSSSGNVPARPPSYESLLNGRGGTDGLPLSSQTKPKTVYSRHGVDELLPRNGLSPCASMPPPYSEETIPKHTVSPNFLNCGGIPLPGLANISCDPPRRSSSDQAWNRYSPLPPTPIISSPVRPGPYDNLSSEQQQYVDSMTGMGFPQDCVVRLVEKYGAEQKVLDVLCSINQISEAGYKKDDIETGLLLLDCDETKTKTYLEALVQLRNMGFEDTNIKEALVESDLDVEQALDLLTA